MTFRKPRFNNKFEYELIRACSKIGHKIHGGASRLLKQFETEYKPKSLISYCDISKFNGKVYEKLGFTLSHLSAPNYFYHNKSIFFSRYDAQKHKLSKILDNFDSSRSESWNMFNNGYSRYWDCGNKVYIKEF